MRHLADEEIGDEVHAVVLDGAPDERVVEDDALAVAGVLREGRAAPEDAAAEDAARVVEALVLVVALGPEPLEDVEEARAVLGLVDGEDAIVEPPRAARVRPEREHLEQRRQPLLHGRGARRALGEPLRHRLRLAVERGGDVDPALVHLEDVDVARAELRAVADLHVVAAGRGVREDPVVGLDAHARVAEEAREALAEPPRGFGRVEGPLVLGGRFDRPTRPGCDRAPSPPSDHSSTLVSRP